MKYDSNGKAIVSPGATLTELTLSGTDQYLDVSTAAGSLTITVDPTSGTMNCYTSTTPLAINNSAHRSWEAWACGEVSALTTDVCMAHVAVLRFTGTGSARVWA